MARNLCQSELSAFVQFKYAEHHCTGTGIDVDRAGSAARSGGAGHFGAAYPLGSFPARTCGPEPPLLMYAR